jgi:diguanylate cyclase (GGDEF)-like protein/PAS domain S-box-containing protein
MGVPSHDDAVAPPEVLPAFAHVAEAGLTQAVPEALAAAGAATGADRCFLFQNVRGSDGRLWMHLREEWLADGAPSILATGGNRTQPYFPSLARWIDVLGEGGIIVGAVDTFPPGERAELAAEGVAWTLTVPVRAGEWWGFVGIDRFDGEGPDPAADVDLVRALAQALGAGVLADRAREDAALHADLYREMVERGPAALYIDGVDDHASTIFIGPQIEQLLGYSPQEWMEQEDMWERVLHPDDRQRALAENIRHNETGEPFVLEYRVMHRDGRVVWIHDEAVMVRDELGVPRYSHGVMLDVSERRGRDEHVAFREYHDELTGLPSRAMFEELLELSLARARRHDGAVAVLCVDLDDFRLVNDSLGHATGDALLQQVADRLREATRETDLVARRGGDQFSLLLADIDADETQPDAAQLRADGVARRIQESLLTPFDVEQSEVYVTASIGISLFPTDADDATAMQRNAEAAMWESKKIGSSGFVLASGRAVDSHARLQFVTRLRKAVDAQRWTLHYQPVVDLATEQMVGVEALIRWIEPDGTMVPPLEFIPLAEELGLIEQIGDWVVRELAYQVTAWRELGIDLEVGFNLSPRQFWQPDLAERIVREIRVSGLDPSRVMVEVTESSAMMDPERAQRILTDLTDHGFAIAIDDFGTGYSSLSRLRDMPVRVLKIDRSFVSNVDRDAQSATIVSAFLALAKGLGMVTLAEGIEREEELGFLRDRGCELGQGFYFSKAVPPEEIIAYALGGIPSAATLPQAG